MSFNFMIQLLTIVIKPEIRMIKDFYKFCKHSEPTDVADADLA